MGLDLDEITVDETGFDLIDIETILESITICRTGKGQITKRDRGHVLILTTSITRTKSVIQTISSNHRITSPVPLASDGDVLAVVIRDGLDVFTGGQPDGLTLVDIAYGTRDRHAAIIRFDKRIGLRCRSQTSQAEDHGAERSSIHGVHVFIPCVKNGMEIPAAAHLFTSSTGVLRNTSNS